MPYLSFAVILLLAQFSPGPDMLLLLKNAVNHPLRAGLWTVAVPTTWSRGEDFSMAPLVLPGLGEPSRPLEGEPGGQLCVSAWLTFEELTEMAGSARTVKPDRHLSKPRYD